MLSYYIETKAATELIVTLNGVFLARFTEGTSLYVSLGQLVSQLVSQSVSQCVSVVWRRHAELYGVA